MIFEKNFLDSLAAVKSWLGRCARSQDGWCAKDCSDNKTLGKTAKGL
jgi:hypothetical protein